MPNTRNCIMPPYILAKLVDSDDPRVREAALNTIAASAHLKGRREASPAARGFLAAPAAGRRSVFDAHSSENLHTATLERTETSDASPDDSVNRAFDGLGATRKFYQEVFGRDSIDGLGMRLDAYVHFGDAMENALWDGHRMLFGDGDGVNFTDFTKSLDVIGHELTHGVTQFTADLEYHNQPGALNESISDVFGCLIKQWSQNETADEADWLIGAEIFTPALQGDALRSMKAPGTAFDGDPQPAHMNDFVTLPDTRPGDWGGVHTNSGIPNKAFYLVATGIGGKAWEAPGHIWYESLRASTSSTDFQAFAETTSAKAAQLYGTGNAEQSAVRTAWDSVGIRLRTVQPEVLAASTDGSLDELQKQVEKLSADVKALTHAFMAGSAAEATAKPSAKSKVKSRK